MFEFNDSPVSATNSTTGKKGPTPKMKAPKPMTPKELQAILKAAGTVLADVPRESVRVLAANLILAAHERQEAAYAAGDTNWMLYGNQVFSIARDVCREYGETGQWFMERIDGKTDPRAVPAVLMDKLVEAGVFFVRRGRAYAYGLGTDPSPKTENARTQARFTVSVDNAKAAAKKAGLI